MLYIIGKFKIADYIFGVKILEPGDRWDCRGNIDSRVIKNRVVTPLSLPQKVLVKDVAAIVLV